MLENMNNPIYWFAVVGVAFCIFSISILCTWLFSKRDEDFMGLIGTNVILIVILSFYVTNQLWIHL